MHCSCLRQPRLIDFQEVRLYSLATSGFHSLDRQNSSTVLYSRKLQARASQAPDSPRLDLKLQEPGCQWNDDITQFNVQAILEHIWPFIKTHRSFNLDER
ncbi:hypothetical protein CC2G_010895 [Coprinopsis cinerea AmutBmut pab1-1]|nr:hypothetical protein CC2G_010895 [Coprinopsis cinerea AmutBmut pab1-1]